MIKKYKTSSKYIAVSIVFSIFAIMYVEKSYAVVMPALSDKQEANIGKLFQDFASEISKTKIKKMPKDIRNKYLETLSDHIKTRSNGKIAEQYRAAFFIAFAFDDNSATEKILKEYETDRVAKWAIAYRNASKYSNKQKTEYLKCEYRQMLDDFKSGKYSIITGRLFMSVSLAASIDENTEGDVEHIFELLKNEPDRWIKFELANLLIETGSKETLKKVKEYINQDEVEIIRTQFYNDYLDLIWEKRARLFILVHPTTNAPFNYSRIAETSGGGKFYLNQRIDELLAAKQ